MPTVVLIGTLDTKGDEYAWLRNRLVELGSDVLVVDTGVREPGVNLLPDVSNERVADAAGGDLRALQEGGDRGAAVTAMGEGAAVIMAELHGAGRVDAVLAVGGSGGSSIAARAVRDLPIGLPKLIVSTMASGDVSPYVGARDVMLMYSVVDIAGINWVSRAILGNAAAAAAGMAKAHQLARAVRTAQSGDRPLIGASMFGVTTPAVDAARERLDELGYEVLVFHATGSGGRALEGLAASGLLAGVLDLTTTELADDLVGGVLSAGPERLTAAGANGVPQVVAPGALDMVNFGPRDTVPARFADRLLYVHNPTVTLMRTTPEEMAELGARMAAKLSAATGPTELFIPQRGVSALDAPGMDFHDPKADEACFEALAVFPATERLDLHINDPEFGRTMAERLHSLISGGDPS
ncbi:Tm-1-like ATP-binding domain-containing protein [Nonomuraea sp. NEAU-A123]|uniref:Tm-1-like ATP-binding domain-containing protein n=1 Tax=Nonomuraea sp. NEAU-A123 TaxID=2839649 RepID=UPI001BE43A66|nr:Tm-1-like ATP-binding domain-containing protein [Nonomuraea sp. NEAU-A123]MBT2232101.1 Tm-1-like ATP-binding domain-containing protein [Nonomuraea sp. NEAU-A123]